MKYIFKLTERIKNDMLSYQIKLLLNTYLANFTKMLLFFGLSFILTTSFVSCNNDSTIDSAEKISSEKSPEHEHEEETIVSVSDEQMKAVGIEVGKVQFKELTSTLKANGMLTVPGNHKADVTFLSEGVVKSILVQLGDHVKKGQVIATVANPRFIQLQEDLLNTNNQIEVVSLEVKRQKELNDGNAGSLRNLQNATAELKGLYTKKASLGQQLRLLGIDPEKVGVGNLRSTLPVLSPIGGVVSTLFAKIGSFISASNPVAEIVDNSSLHLDLQIFEKDLPAIKIGQTIHFTITNNPVKEYDAIVYSIGSAFENDSKSIPVHARVNGDKSGLIDGMNATAIVSLKNNTTPAVPNEAIVEAGGKNYVFVLTNKKVEDTHVEQDLEHQHESTTHRENKVFERMQIVKGTSAMGYTAVTFIQTIPDDSFIVTKGAFFVNAKLTSTGEHEH
ncbi:MAG: efflux RND transporter periplasmic adaptor subunit [Saprospiraceae bacterium]|jgi:cobalt-zinc-cadmium efflux system membrane fusion protein|nr:efflux RND transporter periplasmic adaptor subunit [Saprospiraceae bacterium]